MTAAVTSITATQRGFQPQLARGHMGESELARWLRRKGYNVLPAYQIESGNKGPRLYTPDGRKLVAPDILAIKNGVPHFGESKVKDAASFHRKTGRFVTGIDINHYHDYCQVEEVTGWAVWLYFIQLGKQAKDSPPFPVRGLFGQSLEVLRQNENHRHENWGRSGMIYWAVDTLEYLAPVDANGRIIG